MKEILNSKIFVLFSVCLYIYQNFISNLVDKYSINSVLLSSVSFS